MPWSDFLWKLQILQRFCKFCNRYLLQGSTSNCTVLAICSAGAYEQSLPTRGVTSWACGCATASVATSSAMLQNTPTAPIATCICTARGIRWAHT